ncbi:crotonase [Sphingobium lactosutens]|uniref:enoyl-CoA hydratase-related protein n=1 Tax=Sphingobium lactosutens TaxID=522773 RepID=UPI0015BF7B57|nr:enoyl-CoA hydratase-related protein [Sphingobium lactosutens]NWK97447.1 crotonase [Sphingobium lactosutens]
MSCKYLVIDKMTDGVFSVRLSRGSVNAVDRDMYIELKEIFSDIDTYCPDVRCVVLSGAGRHFCAGNDLDEFATMTPDNGAERMWRVREAFFAIAECPVPVVGAVHGVALGTGLAIAAACDFVVAAEDALFGLPELTVGVMGGARHLARIAPQPLVRRMYFTGEPMQASAFAAAGGAVVTCNPDDLMPRAKALAERIASFSPTALRLSKQILDRIENEPLRRGYEIEQAGTVRMSGHPDSKEALAAFREKRAATYQPLANQ